MMLDRVMHIALVGIAADSHRRQDGTLKPLPMTFTRLEWKRYVGLVLRTEAVLEGRAEGLRRRRSFTRAGGDCVCEQCGLKYYDHPDDIEPEEADDCSSRALTILCSGERVKL